MTVRLRYLAVLCEGIFLSALWSCGQEPGGVRATPGVSPVEDLLPSGVCSVDLFDADDRLHLLCGVRGDDGSAELLASSSDDGGATWTSPVGVVGSAPVAGPSYHNAPQIAARGDDLVVVWTSNGNGFMGRGPLGSARSTDGGKTWISGPDPSPHPFEGSQGFADLVVDQNGTTHLIWLGNGGVEKGPSGLYHASSADAGASWSAANCVDRETCQCCWNRLELGSDGSLYAIYRDIDPRDMSVARMEPAGSWSRLGYAGAFDWGFDGCPHVGGGMFTRSTEGGFEIHSVVWTGKDEVGGVYYVSSRDGGKTWDPPHSVSAGRTMHGDLVEGEDGVLCLAWDEVSDAGSVIHASVSSDGGRSWSDAVALSDGSVDATHPTLAAVEGGFRCVWVDHPEDGDRLRSGFVDLLGALPE